MSIYESLRLKSFIGPLFLLAFLLLGLRSTLAGQVEQNDVRWVMRDMEEDDVADVPYPPAKADPATAVHPDTGNTFRLDPVQNQITETDGDGALVNQYTVADLPIDSVSAMTFASSVDSTDDPGRIALYVWSGDRIIELELLPLSLLQSYEQAPVTTTASLVHTIDASAWVPPSPDSAGLAIADSRLLVTDSEVEEIADMWETDNSNFFVSSQSGNLTNTQDTTGFSDEPTGIAYNPNNDHVFITDDDAGMIHEVGATCAPDCNSLALDTGAYHETVADPGVDPEGIAYGAGQLFIIDGTNEEVYAISLGVNGVLDGDDTVSNFDVETLGIGDPEGIEYDSGTGHLFILSSIAPTVFEVTTDGNLVREIDVSEANLVKGAGIAMVGGNTMFIADRGVDNNVPGENDGRIYEFTVAGLPATETPTSTATSTSTNTPVPTNTSTSTSTNTPVPPTNTSTSTSTNTPVPPTNTSTSTVTSTPVPPTQTPTPSNTPTTTNTPVTLTATSIPVDPSETPTVAPTHTPTGTPTPSWDYIVPMIARFGTNRMEEPNNRCSEAFPIAPFATHSFLAEDTRDWYTFILEDDPSRLTITLQNFAPRDGQIAVYRGESCATAQTLGNYGNPGDEKILIIEEPDVTLPPGRYYIVVANDGALNSVDYYTLRVDTD